MNPFLTCSPLPHPLHRSAIRSPHRQSHCRPIWAIYAVLKPSVGEVASCDETTATITRCAFKVYLVWGKKYRFALTSSTIMGKKVGWSKKTVGFKPTAFEPLALQARVVQFSDKVDQKEHASL